MSLLGPYVHRIDPIIGTIFGVHLWWYGLSYSLGFLNAHLFLKRRRPQLGVSLPGVYSLSLSLAIGILLGGRFVEVAFYEWPFYRGHVHLIPAYWLGGMATHGLLLGGLLGAWAFCRVHGKSLLSVTDSLAIPAAVIMGLGRIGNFIDGQIVGSVTTVCWGVKFPDAEGFRHPVVLYDGLKNLLIVPMLLYAATHRLPTGAVTGMFLFLYGFLRIFVDLFRDYTTTVVGLPTEQFLNILFSVLGIVLIVARWGRRPAPAAATVADAAIAAESQSSVRLGWRRVWFATLVLFSLTIASDSTRDVPAHYGSRHACLRYSAIYPRIGPALERLQPKTRSQSAPNQSMQPTR